MLNQQVKFREYWRPFSSSLLDRVAAEYLPPEFHDEYMCISAPMNQKWQEKYPGLAAKDGAARIHVVREESNADFYTLLERFEAKTGHGVLINATLSRPGEALVCTPEDAVSMFLGTDLNYMIMENVLVTKRAESDSW
jgi:carbamoyltransferase